MTIEELQDHIWDELPFLRKNLVGRDRVDDLVLVAIEQAPVEYIGHADPNSSESDVVAKAWQQSIKRGYSLLYGGEESEMGPVFWLLISPVLQAVVKKLLEWWWNSPRNRVLLAGWKRRLCCD